MTAKKAVSGGGVRDSKRTREAILRAAQLLYARKGYTTVGVREVAAEAGIDSTLIRRYFVSKEGLLRAAVEEMLQLAPFIEGDRAQFGERAIAVLRMGETMPSALAMMILATADEDARAMCSDLMHEHITTPLAEWLGGRDAQARAAQINLLWIGFMAAREVLPLPSLAGRDVETTRTWLAATLQAIVDAGD